VPVDAGRIGENDRVPDLITSFANPTVKRYRALAARKNRRREGSFTVEGLQPVWFAVRSTWPIDTLIVSPDLLTNEAAWQMVDEAGRDGTVVVWVSRDVFAHLSDRDGPSGLAAIVRGTVGSLPGFRPAGAGPVVALHRVGNPGNIGTILRSADAAGAAGLLLVGDCADPLAPTAVKASMGSLFSVPIAAADAEDELFEWAGSVGRPVVAITGNTSENLWRATVPADAVLLMGSEGDGLSADMVRRCEAALAIPMQGSAESLNLATATSVALFELSRRRIVGE
jgi:TrmH family RNA methyltransferase